MGHLLYHHSGYQHFIRPSPSALPELPEWAFNPQRLAEENVLTGTATGRAPVWFFTYQNHRMVLRHYWRGGFVAHLTPDRFIWQGLRRSRPWRELHILMQLRELGMTVPNPVGAKIERDRHRLLYRADIVTEEIPNALPLPDFFRAARSRNEHKNVCIKAGIAIAQLHALGAKHADLNVRNILVSPPGEISVIDWDKGSISTTGKTNSTSARRTLERLRRSIKKDPLLRDSHAEIFANIEEGYSSIRPTTESDAK